MKTTEYTTMKTVFNTITLLMLLCICNGGYAQKVYYSWNSGDWNATGANGTWSLNDDDFQPVTVPPTADDEVYISKPVTISSAGAVAKKVHLNSSLTISGGVPHFDELVGHGNMFIEGDVYPEVTEGNDYFAGMVALNGTFTINRAVDHYKTLSFNIQSGTVTFNNSNLKIGTLRIGGGAAINSNLEIIDDIVIDADCSLTSIANTTLKTNGNIVSSGSIKLEGNLLFASTDRNQTLSLKAKAEFAKITVQKGTTNYYADIMADATGLLKLADNAIDLQSGTLMIGSNITIDALSKGKDFNIPANAELQVAGGTVKSTNNINVSGALSVTSGALQTSNNTIKLNGGSFNIDGGQSSVMNIEDNGQASIFSQSAGSIAIEKLLLTSANSTYKTSGGTTTIVRDLTLTCNHAVTGGTIIKDIEGGNFTISVPLYNLTINKGVNFNNSSFEIRGNLSIANGLDIGFNDRDISIAGNLTLGTGAQMSNMRSITFEGSRNSEINIPAAFTFPKKMIVDKSGNHSVIINGADVTVTEDLSVLAGNLNANGNAINALSNVTNDGNIVGTLNLNGDNKTISGSGIFDIINQNVATITLDSRITANRYDFTAGKCYLNSYVVTLKEGTNGGAEHYFVNNGDKASAGLCLNVKGGSFSAGDNVAEWPIGTSSYYAPAFVVAKESATFFNEYITMGAVGKQHPCLKTANGENLPCYWTVKTENKNTCKFILKFDYPYQVVQPLTSLALLDNSEWVESDIMRQDYEGDPEPCGVKMTSKKGWVYNVATGKYSNKKTTQPNVYDCGEGPAAYIVYTDRTITLSGWSYQTPTSYWNKPKMNSTSATTFGIDNTSINFNNCTESATLKSGEYTAGVKKNSEGMRILIASAESNTSATIIGFYSSDWRIYGTSTPATPQAGDICIIEGCTFVNASTAIDNVGKIIFQYREGQSELGRLRISVTGCKAGSISGKGEIQFMNDNSFFLDADCSEFDANDESFYHFSPNSSNNYKFHLDHDGVFPNVTIEHNADNENAIFIYDRDLYVRNILNLMGSSSLKLDGHNVYCGTLAMGGYGGANVYFTAGKSDELVVGDIDFDFKHNVSADNARYNNKLISITGTADAGASHNKLIITGNIVNKLQEPLKNERLNNKPNIYVGLDLFNANDYVELWFAGDNNQSVQVSTTNFKFNVKQMVINKEPGSSIKLSDVKVNFDEGLTGGETDNKTLVLKSGEVIFDVDGQIVPLSKEGQNNKHYDFVIPEEATLTANKGVTLNVSNCKTGITLAGTLNLNDNAKLMNEGHFYYRLTNKTILNIANAIFESKGDFCPDPATGSGSIRWNITSSNASVKIGGAGCGYATSNSQIDIAEGSEISVPEGGVINFIGNSTNSTIFNVGIMSDADCKYGPDSDPISTTFVFQNGTFDISSKPSVPHLIMQNAALTLQTLPLNVLGNFTLKNTATFDANGKNINFKGQYFTIEGENTFTPNGNTVTFSGTNQSVSGSAIKFYNATISNTSGQVEFVYPHIITNELKITEGANLHDTGAGFPIIVETKYTNTLGSYTGEGGIALNSGTQNHTIEVFCNGNTSRLIVNNPTGVTVTNSTGQKLTIDKALDVFDGVLNMGSTTLVLGKDVENVGYRVTYKTVEIDGQPTEQEVHFDASRMIVFESTNTICGIEKHFDGNYSGSFVMPMGVTGKYTPALIDVTSINDNATITISPKNAMHPSIVNDIEYDTWDLTDKDNALKFYWKVETSGTTNFEGNLKFYNDLFDYQESEGKEHNRPLGYHYLAARLLKGKAKWDKSYTGNDSYDKGYTTFSSEDFLMSNDATLCGDYTAGLGDKYGVGAIPGNVNVYVSLNNGTWADKNRWAAVKVEAGEIQFDTNGDVVTTTTRIVEEVHSDGTITTTEEDVEIPDMGPEPGSIVFVYDSVYVEVNELDVYRTFIAKRHSDDVPGVIDLMASTSHRLGMVEGIGKIITRSGNMPRGTYDDFIKPGSGTIEFAGEDIDYNISMSTFNNVIFSGNGQRVLSPDELVVNGYLMADGANGESGLKVINTNGATWNLYGKLVYNGGTFIAPTEGSISTIKMCGDNVQQFVSKDLNNIERLQINILEINNSSSEGVDVVIPIDIVQHITFDKGVLNVDDLNGGELRIVESNPDVDETVKNYDINKFVNGPLTKKILANDSWTFPVGSHLNCDKLTDVNRLGHFTVYNFIPKDNSGFGYVTVRYLYKPHDESGNTEKYGEGILGVDKSEYWTVTPTTASTFGLKLRWDEVSNIANTESDIKNVCITNYDGDLWNKIESDVHANSAYTGLVTSIPSDIEHLKDQAYVYTLAHTGALTFNWEGSVSSNWFDSDNWSGRQVPSESDYVIVGSLGQPDWKYPVINTSDKAKAKYLKLTGNAKLTIDPRAQLTVITDVVVDNTSSLLLAAPKTSVDGSGDQSINPAGSLIYKGTFTGKLTFQRFVRCWEYERMCVPVTGYNANVSSFKYAAYLYGYNEKCNVGGDEYTYSYEDNQSGADNPLILAKGWYKYGNDYPKTNDVTVPYRYLSSSKLPAHILSFTGTPLPDGSQSIVTTVNFTSNDRVASSGSAQDMLDGWNFVANPFVSAVDAEALKFHNVDATIYLHNSKTNTPIAYSINGGLQLGVVTEDEYRYIPAGQSFFVHATAQAAQNNGTVEFPKESRSHGNSKTVLKSGNQPSNKGIEKIVFKTTGGDYDYQSLVYFAADATEAFDSKYDAYMVSASAPKLLSFYTYGSDEKVALTANGLPFEVKDGGEVRIGYSTVTAGTYRLTIPVLTVDDVDVYLEDAQEGTSTKLSEGFSTKIDVEAGSNKTRFKLVFRQKPEEPVVVEPIVVIPSDPIEVPEEPVIVDPVVINPTVPDVTEPEDLQPEVKPLPEPFDDGELMHLYPSDQSETDVERDIRVNVYPVPSYGVVTVSLGELIQETGSVKIVVASISGRVVVNKTVADDLVEIDLTGRPGVYIVRMMTPTKSIVKRIVIE